MSDPHPAAQDVVDLYDRRAADWAEDRREMVPIERAHLARFIDGLPPGASILDAGCGNGRPIGAWLKAQGFAVVGVDAAAGQVARAKADLPAGDWRLGDLRTLDLAERFDAVLAWHSLFHLTPDDQPQALARLIAHARPDARLMFTTGPDHGERIGDWRGEPLYHGSLSPEAYRAILEDAGFAVEVVTARDPSGGTGAAWLASRGRLAHPPARG